MAYRSVHGTRSMLGPFSGLCVVFLIDTSLSLSPPRCINGNREIVGTTIQSAFYEYIKIILQIVIGFFAPVK